eukprot:s1329_g9.t1
MVAKDAKEVPSKATAATPNKGPRTRIPCFICKRWFPSAAHLKRHERHSDLHRSNAEKQDELTYQRKAELKLAVHCAELMVAAKEDEGAVMRIQELERRGAIMESGAMRIYQRGMEIHEEYKDEVIAKLRMESSINVSTRARMEQYESMYENERTLTEELFRLEF